MTLEPAVTHRLKNKITIILGFCELLLNELPEGDRHRADVLQIQEAARAALRELPPLPANDFTGAVDTEGAHDK